MKWTKWILINQMNKINLTILIIAYTFLIILHPWSPSIEIKRKIKVNTIHQIKFVKSKSYHLAPIKSNLIYFGSYLVLPPIRANIDFQ